MATTTTKDSIPAAPPPSRIPTFASIEEEAEFWDTHDTTEFEDEWEEVDDVVFIGLAPNGRMYLWFEPEVVAALSAEATAQGTYPARLARRWILEKLGFRGDLGTGPD